MKVVFWNLEGASPLTSDIAKKGADVAKAVMRMDADVMIFSEILEAAPDELAIDELRLIGILCSESTKSKEFFNPMDRVHPKLRHKIKSGLDEIGMEETGRRNPYRFKAKHKIRTNAHAISTIKRATGILDTGTIKRRLEYETEKLTLRNKALMEKLDVSEIVKTYPYRHAHDAVQKNRNYLVFSKTDFKIGLIDVVVPGAKRPILRIDLGARVIFAIHAPAFAKGGHDTVNQLCTLIANEPVDTIAIGDMNIDVEELGEEIAAGRVPPLGIGPQVAGYGTCAPFTIKRRRRNTHLTIDKTVPNTQQSGGTLDYCLARNTLALDAAIEVDCGVMSDHAAISVTY